MGGNFFKDLRETTLLSTTYIYPSPSVRKITQYYVKIKALLNLLFNQFYFYNRILFLLLYLLKKI